MSDPNYRQATSDDAETIAEIINTLVQEPNPVGFDGPTTAENVRTWLARQGDEGGIFLGLLDGEAAGFRALASATHPPASPSISAATSLRAPPASPSFSLRGSTADLIRSTLIATACSRAVASAWRSRCPSTSNSGNSV